MHSSAKPANPTSSHGLRRGKIKRNAVATTAIIPSSIATFARTVMESALIHRVYSLLPGSGALKNSWPLLIRTMGLGSLLLLRFTSPSPIPLESGGAEDWSLPHPAGAPSIERIKRVAPTDAALPQRNERCIEQRAKEDRHDKGRPPSGTPGPTYPPRHNCRGQNKT